MLVRVRAEIGTTDVRGFIRKLGMVIRFHRVDKSFIVFNAACMTL